MMRLRQMISALSFSLMNLVLLATLFGTATIVQGQIRIITNAYGDSLRINWDHDWKDILGNTESVSYFRVYLSRNDSAFVPVGTTPSVLTGHPVTTYKFTNIVKNVKYAFGVSAVDLAGNESAIHKSTDNSAAYGGWFLVIDNIAPRSASGMRPF